jgi:hypothetical protein
VGFLVLPFVTVKAGLLCRDCKVAPLLRARCKRNGTVPLCKKHGTVSVTVKKRGDLRCLVKASPAFVAVRLRWRYGKEAPATSLTVD